MKPSVSSIGSANFRYKPWLEQYDVIVTTISLREALLDLQRAGYLTQQDYLVSPICKAFRMMGAIMDDELDFEAKRYVPRADEASRYLEEYLFDSINLNHCVVRVEVVSRYLLNVYQIREVNERRKNT